MNFKNAINEISKEYKISEYAPDLYILQSTQLLDESTCYFIAIRDMKDKVILTDYAKTCDVINLSEEEFKTYCKKYNLSFEDWNITCEYKSNNDLKNFIALLDEISSL